MTLNGEPGRDYRLLSAVLRNTGNGWHILTDVGHRPSGITGITTHANRLEIAHPVDAIRVSSVQVTPDEALAARGVRVGISVGLDRSFLYLYTAPPPTGGGPAKPRNPADLAVPDGNLWITGFMEV
ncbi:hypothetical protein [Streptomyces sp. 4R-3d]|uniref:hypothetical protein n=1 Tax=Streptomyces sp. 4R-3d TaxID=2559605 RepID=UPI0010727131|nr:hypothetical protein [Streptomyces sp. 4R-3d]TFI30175.1 hypothetical protein E4P36_05365 [Streptomyces sp. 4R-3d]